MSKPGGSSEVRHHDSLHFGALFLEEAKVCEDISWPLYPGVLHLSKQIHMNDKDNPEVIP